MTAKTGRNVRETCKSEQLSKWEKGVSKLDRGVPKIRREASKIEGCQRVRRDKEVPKLET